jgi:hypothetical protein
VLTAADREPVLADTTAFVDAETRNVSSAMRPASC